MTNKIMPALIGGLVGGVLSFIPLLGCLCAIGGGVLAGYLYIRKAPEPVKTGEGATLGAIAGVLAGLIRITGGLLLAFLLSQSEGLEAQLHSYGIQIPFSASAILVVATVFGGLIILILSIVGGLISVPLFEKRKRDATAPPPPPQDFAAS
ncbi:MAG: hypothetical protein QOE77_1287 [Blastocatellia bacterium]|jgi:hypothetical protein|nr:hypothetical protein [Blastocatellia bacterium]